jgi:hypothetical protein
MYTTKQLPSAAMETLKQFSDKHVSMETYGQQYNTTSTLNLVTQQINEYRGGGGIRILNHNIAMFVNADQ